MLTVTRRCCFSEKHFFNWTCCMEMNITFSLSGKVTIKQNNQMLVTFCRWGYHLSHTRSRYDTNDRIDDVVRERLDRNTFTARFGDRRSFNLNVVDLDIRRSTRRIEDRRRLDLNVDDFHEDLKNVIRLGSMLPSGYRTRNDKHVLRKIECIEHVKMNERILYKIEYIEHVEKNVLVLSTPL